MLVMASGSQVFNISLPISLGVGNLITFFCNIGRMLDFEDDEFDEPSAMVQINTPNPKDLKAYPEQRTILRMRYFKIHPKFQTSIVSIRRGDHIICMGDHTIHRGDHIIRRGDHYDGTNYLRCLLVSEQATVQSSSVGQKQVNPPLLFLIFFATCRSSITHMGPLSPWYSSAVKSPQFRIKLDSNNSEEAAKTWRLKK